MADALMYRRTRIVCISDTHNCTVKLPKGDVLIHAGDLTNQGSYSEGIESPFFVDNERLIVGAQLSKAVKWLEQADFESKIVIAGNHDITLDKDFFAEHGLYFHNQNLQSPEECLSLLTSSPSITYLNHESTTIRLTSPSGPRTQFTVFGSPFSPRHGLWAFNYDSPQNPSSCTDLTTIWDRIPLDTDIVVTHTPPKTHCDETEDRRAAGCEALRRSLWRVRPRLAVCGHVHPGRGAERVAWDLSSRNIAYKESGILRWQDPGEGNNKISLVDLTGRKAPSLANDGSHPGRSHRPSCLEGPATIPSRDTVGSAGPPPFSFSSNDVDAQVCRSNIGLGGDATSLRSDQPALAGRMGRRETCVVNAAIMKKNYPHVGSRQLNKAIVVDLDLPVWED